MHEAQPNLFTRDDTFFGVCQAIGEDLGFSPNFLRIAFAVGVFFNPVGAIAAYALLGMVVLATRLLFPQPRSAAQNGKAAAPAAAEPAEAVAEAEEELKIAA